MPLFSFASYKNSEVAVLFNIISFSFIYSDPNYKMFQLVALSQFIILVI